MSVVLGCALVYCRVPGSARKVYIDRRAAMDHRADPSGDPDCRNAVFCQLFESLKPREDGQKPLDYRYVSKLCLHYAPCIIAVFGVIQHCVRSTITFWLLLLLGMFKLIFLFCFSAKFWIVNSTCGMLALYLQLCIRLLADALSGAIQGKLFGSHTCLCHGTV